MAPNEPVELRGSRVAFIPRLAPGLASTSQLPPFCALVASSQLTLPPTVFQSMMSGAECSTSSTPLASLLKQQQTDHSLHQSNFSQPGPSAGSLRTHTPTGALQHEDADRFFQQQQMGGPGSGQFANMDSIRRELEGVSRASPQSALKGDRGELQS